MFYTNFSTTESGYLTFLQKPARLFIPRSLMDVLYCVLTVKQLRLSPPKTFCSSRQELLTDFSQPSAFQRGSRAEVTSFASAQLQCTYHGMKTRSCRSRRYSSTTKAAKNENQNPREALRSYVVPCILYHAPFCDKTGGGPPRGTV